MYSTILLEDFTSGLRRFVAYNKPTSTFIAGLLTGLYSTSYRTVIHKGLLAKGISDLFNHLEDKYEHKLEPIVNKFTIPIDKVTESIKDDSFIAPTSKFYDIIQSIVTILLLFLGFAIGKIIAILLGKEKKEGLLKQYKKFIRNNLITFVLVFIAIQAIKPWISRAVFGGELQKIDFTAFKNSDNKIENAVAKVYDLVVAKYPKFAKVPLYYALVDDPNSFGFYAAKLSDKSVIGMPKKLEIPLTEDELVAIYLHEFGHLLNMFSTSLLVPTVVQYVVLRVQLFTRISEVQLVTELGSNIIDRFLNSVASFNQEIVADTFAVSMGYGKQLKSALQKLVDSIRGSASTTSDHTNAFIQGFLSHPSVDRRFKNIESLEKYYQQQTNELVQKSTEVVKDGLNKENVNV
jgi:Zn-dependent protease with chaperone function